MLEVMTRIYAIGVANPESNFKGNPCFLSIICCLDLKENYMIKNLV